MSKTLITIGLMSMLAFSLVLFIVFASAYFSPSKAINVEVNTMGEADVEMALISLLLPISIIASIFTIRRLDQQEKESYILKSLEQRTSRRNSF